VQAKRAVGKRQHLDRLVTGQHGQRNDIGSRIGSFHVRGFAG